MTDDSLKVTNSFPSVKWRHYEKCYASHLPEKPKSILEIGIAGGGSLINWRQLFPDARIAGIDINPECKRMEKEGFEVFIGSQTNKAFLEKIGNSGPWEVVIDDGGHRPYQILSSFHTLWPSVSAGGLYVIEDLQMAEKVRWKIWQKLFGGPRGILMKLYRKMNYFVTDGPSSKPHEIHLYPHILFVKNVITHTDSCIENFSIKSTLST